MVVCSCNFITSQAIEKALRSGEGCCRISDVYGQLGCQPQCGRCAPTIAQIMKDVSASNFVDTGCCQYNEGMAQAELV